MNYFELTPEQIYNDKEILKNFLSLYSEKTGELNLNAGCISCIPNYQKKLFNLMENKDKKYLFNEKYDGVYFETDYIINAKLTEQIAKKFIKTYVDEKNPISEFFARYPIEVIEKTKK